MREMKNRLLAIEAELQTLYRETGDESEVSREFFHRVYARLMFRRLSFDDRLLLALVIFHVEHLA